MTRNLRTATQVIDFAKRLAPEQRRALKRALQDLRHERGDLRALEGSLTGYYRLRVGRFRLIFAYAEDGFIDAVFLEERSLVYEVFEAEFVKRLKS
jgi:mRNA interferase RelE/StbE